MTMTLCTKDKGIRVKVWWTDDDTKPPSLLAPNNDARFAANPAGLAWISSYAIEVERFSYTHNGHIVFLCVR